MTTTTLTSYVVYQRCVSELNELEYVFMDRFDRKEDAVRYVLSLTDGFPLTQRDFTIRQERQKRVSY